MADLDDVQDGKNYYLDKPQQSAIFRLKGSNALDWGMKNRLARIFEPDDGRTVMLAVDHGYFQGATTGLERIDLTIVPLLPYADALMVTRGALRSSIPPEIPNAVVLRSTGGQSILKELSNERVAVDIEDAVRLNASALAAQVYIGGVHEHESIGNLDKARRRWKPSRDSNHGSDRRWKRAGTGCEVSGSCHPDLRRNGRALCENLLLRERLCASGCGLPGSAGNCGRQETA